MTAHDDDLITAVRRSREEEARFFADQAETERWVVQEFLMAIGLSFSPDELISQPQADNVDVVFREARFQIKEIYDPQERRDAEIRDSIELAKAATVPADLYPPPVARDIQLADLTDLLLAKACSLKFPPRERASLDLLCYVTRPYAGFNERPELAGQRLSSLGWRSISCLLGTVGYRLTSSPKAPAFLQQQPGVAQPVIPADAPKAARR